MTIFEGGEVVEDEGEAPAASIVPKGGRGGAVERILAARAARARDDRESRQVSTLRY